MPVVPGYGNRQVQQSGIPNVSLGSNAPLEAFGGGQSAAAVTDAATGVAEVSKQIAIEEKKKADQVAFMQADRQASELQTQLQVNLGKMRGQDSFGAPDVIAKQWSDSVAKIKDGLANSDQQAAFDRASTNRWEELNRHTQLYVADQKKAFDDDQTKSYIETSRNNATLNAKDDHTVELELVRQEAAAKEWAKRNGVSGTDAEKAKITEITSSTRRDVISARVDGGDTKGAVAYFEANKAGLTAVDLLHAQKTIEEGKTLDAGVATWDKVKGLRLSDGNPDEGKMEKAVMADPDLSTKEKMHVLQFVKARAGEEFVNKTKQDAAIERTFMNNVVSGRQQGVSLQDALKVANKMGTDSYDQSIKAEAVRKIYAPPSVSDPATYVTLWERIHDKNVDKTDIDLAMQRNLINATDWRGLREAYYKVNTEGRNEQEKSAYERVKILAQEKFGSDRIESEKFMYDLHQANHGKSPQEIWKDANDKLKGDANTGLFGWFQDKQYKTDVERLDVQNLAWGKLHQEIGRKETNAIGKGFLYSGKKSWSVSDVSDFAEQLGGYQNIQPGTPAHNAMQFLIKNNQIVTPANVKAVLERSKVGQGE